MPHHDPTEFPIPEAWPRVSIRDTERGILPSSSEYSQRFSRMRDFAPDLCWLFVGPDRVCILSRGHDDGKHESRGGWT